MSVSPNLRKFLIAGLATAQVRHNVNVDVDEGKNGEVYVWFQQTGIRSEGCLGDERETEPFGVNFTLEVISRNIAKMDAMADQAHQLLADYSGELVGGDAESEVTVVFVTDADEEYIPRGANTNDGFNIRAFEVEVIL